MIQRLPYVEVMILVLLTLAKTEIVIGQLNMELLGKVSYVQRLNDVWGWVDPKSGTEYALTGTTTGVSIVSLKNPQNPMEVAFARGAVSTWRDIKTWNGFAYVTNETDSGLMVIDLRNLPDVITWWNWSPNIPDMGQLKTAHNLFIDGQGYCYLAGSNLNAGGVIILDVFSVPGTPQFVGAAAPAYAHDVFVQRNKMYTSELYKGAMAIYDVYDKKRLVLLASHQTPYNFTHNTWVNSSSKVAFTTDEKPNAPVTAYEISDLSAIKELDQFKPKATLNRGVIPHNVHVINDWLVISYYSDGGIIVDASRPSNMVEVANWDTYPGPGAGFNGAWGAYPYLPSGLILISDIQNGLFICKPNYVRACWLEGAVRNALTNSPVPGADIEIISSQPNKVKTNGSGRFKTGQSEPGKFFVEITALGFYPKIVEVVLQNGHLTEINIELTPLPVFTVSGQVLEANSKGGIPNAQILLKTVNSEFNVRSDQHGNFKFNGLPQGTYELTVGAWGFKRFNQYLLKIDSALQSINVLMDKGYQDDFQFDLGWTVQHGASTGWWVRGNPVGTILGPAQCNPDTDVPTDNGNSCFITGNAGGAANTDDVDNGIVTLISPVMDLRGYKKPIVSYQHWFANLGGNTIANDTLFIKVSNGSDTILLDAITSHSGIWKQTIRALPHGYATQNMRLIVSTADKSESDHVLEAAFDAFEVYDLEWTMPVMYSKQNGCSPFQIQFIDLSDDQENRTWTFPGGTPLQSSDKYPVVTYTAPGHFDVQLKTTSREGNIQEYTFEHLVSVFAPPVANFSFDANEREVVFQNTSSSALDFWWDFGDGEASKVRNPVHRYARANEYLVTLRAVNHCGTDRYSMKVPVNLTSVKEMGNIAVIRIWPNPFKNEVIIEYHIPISLQNAVLKVHNTAGQLIEAKKLSGNQGKIRTGQNWPSDRLYVVSVISGEKQLLSRIVFKN